MKASREDLIKYRLLRAKDTFEDAQILAERQKWNSTINRLYYSIRRKFYLTLNQYKN